MELDHQHPLHLSRDLDLYNARGRRSSSNSGVLFGSPSLRLGGWPGQVRPIGKRLRQVLACESHPPRGCVGGIEVRTHPPVHLHGTDGAHLTWNDSGCDAAPARTQPLGGIRGVVSCRRRALHLAWAGGPSVQPSLGWAPRASCSVDLRRGSSPPPTFTTNYPAALVARRHP